jgi:uncharacterized membrane protein
MHVCDLTQQAFGYGFGAKFRDEWLTERWFRSLADGHEIIGARREAGKNKVSTHKRFRNRFSL